MGQTTMDWTGANDAFSGSYDPNQANGSSNPGAYGNQGNDFGGSIFGQASAPDNVYFGGTPLAAGGMAHDYRSAAARAMKQKGPQIGGAGVDAYNQQMGGANAGFGNAQQGNSDAQMNQRTAMGQMFEAARGNGPSAAQNQMQSGLEQGINANMAMANSARGQAGVANAQKNALGQNAQMAGAAANQSAQLRAQEMQQAQSQYAGMSNQMQNQYAQQQQGYLGLGMQGAQGLQGNAYNQAQLQAGQNALNQQGDLAYQQLAFNAHAENMQAQMNNQNNAYGLNQSNAAAAGKAASGLIGAAGTAMMMSDARAKDNIRDAGPELDKALGAIHPHQYEYKDGLGQPPGTQTGIMAQELASTDAGSKLVAPHPAGGMGVKIPEATSFALAGLARLNERIDSMQRDNIFGDAKLQEPNGGSAGWTLREEPDFILAKNDRTGELQKVLTAPLSAGEHHQAVNRPHGAGPISRAGDMHYGDMPLTGGIAPVMTRMAPKPVAAAPVAAGGGTFDALASMAQKYGQSKLDAAAAGKGGGGGPSGNFTNAQGGVDVDRANAFSKKLGAEGYGMTDAQTGQQWNVPGGAMGPAESYAPGGMNFNPNMQLGAAGY